MPATSEMTNKERVGVAIIGAGAVGLCCALRLLREGFAVEIFDHREPGTGASLGNAGIIASSEVLPLSRSATVRRIPRMLLDPRGPLVVRWRYLPHALPWLARFVRAAARAKETSSALTALLRPAVDSWSELARDQAFENLLEVSGWLRISPDRATLERSRSELEWQRALGVNVEILDGNELAELEPNLVLHGRAAAFYPDVGSLRSPLKVMQKLAEGVARAGGSFHRTRIDTIDTSGEDLRLLDEAGAAHRFARTVIAAGAWSRTLMKACGANVPLDSERGYHAMLRSPQATISRPVTLLTPGYTLAQMTEGLRLTTGVEFAGLEAPPTMHRLRHTVRHAATIVPGLETMATSEWLGFRPSTPDSLPVVGQLRTDSRIVAAFGHGHLGLTLAPITGNLVADILTGRPLPPIAEAISPDRFRGSR